MGSTNSVINHIKSIPRWTVGGLMVLLVGLSLFGPLQSAWLWQTQPEAYIERTDRELTSAAEGVVLQQVNRLQVLAREIARTPCLRGGDFREDLHHLRSCLRAERITLGARQGFALYAPDGRLMTGMGEGWDRPFPTFSPAVFGADQDSVWTLHVKTPITGSLPEERGFVVVSTRIRTPSAVRAALPWRLDDQIRRTIGRPVRLQSTPVDDEVGRQLRIHLMPAPTAWYASRLQTQGWGRVLGWLSMWGLFVVWRYRRRWVVLARRRPLLLLASALSIRVLLVVTEIPDRFQSGKRPLAPLFDPAHLGSGLGIGWTDTVGGIWVTLALLWLVFEFLRAGGRYRWGDHASHGSWTGIVLLGAAWLLAVDVALRLPMALGSRLDGAVQLVDLVAGWSSMLCIYVAHSISRAVLPRWGRAPGTGRSQEMIVTLLVAIAIAGSIAVRASGDLLGGVLALGRLLLVLPFWVLGSWLWHGLRTWWHPRGARVRMGMDTDVRTYWGVRFLWIGAILYLVLGGLGTWFLQAQHEQYVLERAHDLSQRPPPDTPSPSRVFRLDPPDPGIDLRFDTRQPVSVIRHRLPVGGVWWMGVQMAQADGTRAYQVVQAPPALASADLYLSQSLGVLWGGLLVLIVLLWLWLTWQVWTWSRPMVALAASLRSYSVDAQTSFPLPERRDEWFAVVSALNDALEQLVRHRELRAQRARETAWRDMARHVAHDLSNPLTPIKLRLQHLQSRAKDAAERDALGGLVRQVDGLAELAKSFQWLAEGKATVASSVVLSDMVQEEVDARMDLMQGRLTAEIEPVAARMLDAPAWRRVIQNLLTNAQQATEHGGSIQVSLQEVPGEGLVLRVADQGVGIAPEIRSRIFEPRFTTRSAGTGHGLAMVRQIVLAHGGTVTLEDDNAWTVFRVVLSPLVRDAPEASS